MEQVVWNGSWYWSTLKTYEHSLLDPQARMESASVAHVCFMLLLTSCETADAPRDGVRLWGEGTLQRCWRSECSRYEHKCEESLESHVVTEGIG